MELMNGTNHNHRSDPYVMHIESAYDRRLAECYIQEFIMRRIKAHAS